MADRDFHPSLSFPVLGLGAKPSPIELEGDGEVAEGGEARDAFVALGAGDNAEVHAGKRGELLLAQARLRAGVPQEIDQTPDVGFAVSGRHPRLLPEWSTTATLKIFCHLTTHAE